MKRFTFVLFLFACLVSSAQNKKAPANKPIQKNAEELKDQPKAWEDDTTAATDSTKLKLLEAETKMPREFMVYTKKPKNKTERTKLCFNLVSKDTVLNFCVNDSLCRNPEVSKILFESQKGDTNYVLVYVDAFSKPGDDYPQCNSGHESKIVLVRWNTKTNKAKWKQKTFCSCLRNITNMTKEPITNWDGTGPLVISYFKGGADFPELNFDPSQPQLGIKDSSDNIDK